MKKEHIIPVLLLVVAIFCVTMFLSALMQPTPDTSSPSTTTSDSTQSTPPTKQDTTPDNSLCQMEKVGESLDFMYYRDIVTDVMYLWRKPATAEGVALTVMPDPATGLPMTYTRYKTLYESASNGGNLQ